MSLLTLSTALLVLACCAPQEEEEEEEEEEEDSRGREGRPLSEAAPVGERVTGILIVVGWCGCASDEGGFM
eukprot:1604270-Rhodomonas_salina.2